MISRINSGQKENKEEILTTMLHLTKVFALFLVICMVAHLEALPRQVAFKDVEAMTMVDALLTDSPDADHQDTRAYVSKKIATLKDGLDNMIAAQVNAESSKQGEIRGAAKELINDLLEFERLEINKLSAFGQQLADFERKTQKQWAQLDGFLAAMVSWKSDSLQQQQAQNLARHHEESREEEKSWLSQLRDWILN